MLETFLCTSLYYFRFQGKNLASDQHEDQCASQVNESLQFSESPDEITSMIKQTLCIGIQTLLPFLESFESV